MYFSKQKTIEHYPITLAYREPSQTSKMKHFTKYLTAFSRSLFSQNTLRCLLQSWLRRCVIYMKLPKFWDKWQQNLAKFEPSLQIKWNFVQGLHIELWGTHFWNKAALKILDLEKLCSAEQIAGLTFSTIILWYLHHWFHQNLYLQLS